MCNIIAKINKRKHVTGGYLSIIQLSSVKQHLYIGKDSNRAEIFDSKEKAKERIALFCRLNPDYETSDFTLNSF